jgi:hypothetical protein
MTMPKNGVWKIIGARRRRASLDGAAQAETASSPDGAAQAETASSPDGAAQAETASSPDGAAQAETPHRRLLGKEFRAWAGTFGTNVTAALAVVVVGAAAGFVGFLDRSVFSSHREASPSVSQAASRSTGSPFAVLATEDFLGGSAIALPAALDGRSYAQLTAGFLTDANWGAFLGSVSGAPVAQVGIALTFTGEIGSSVRITNIEVKQAKPPGPDDSGAYIPIPHQGGGDNSYNFTVDLDHPNATLQGVAGQEDFPGFEINVSANLDSTVYVQFTGMKHSYSWVFVVDYDQNGTPEALQVGPTGGDFFTLSGPSGQYGQVFAATGQGYVLTTRTEPGGQ